MSTIDQGKFAKTDVLTTEPRRVMSMCDSDLGSSTSVVSVAGDASEVSASVGRQHSASDSTSERFHVGHTSAVATLFQCVAAESVR